MHQEKAKQAIYTLLHFLFTEQAKKNKFPLKYFNLLYKDRVLRMPFKKTSFPKSPREYYATIALTWPVETKAWFFCFIKPTIIINDNIK